MRTPKALSSIKLSFVSVIRGSFNARLEVEWILSRTPSGASMELQWATLSVSQPFTDIYIQGRLPALGWSSWNAYYCDIDETKILTAANKVVSLGLKDVGYSYINSTSTCPP